MSNLVYSKFSFEYMHMASGHFLLSLSFSRVSCFQPSWLTLRPVLFSLIHTKNRTITIHANTCTLVLLPSVYWKKWNRTVIWRLIYLSLVIISLLIECVVRTQDFTNQDVTSCYRGSPEKRNPDNAAYHRVAFSFLLFRIFFLAFHISCT